MEDNKIWKFIEFNDNWRNADTSLIDDISSSWMERRRILEKNSTEYKDFIDMLKREHAIETGIVERMYDLDRGVTETLIREGFIQTYISHEDTNIPVPALLSHLKDHTEAIDFIFDVVKSDRPFTIQFIKELHALVTRNQKYIKAKDQFGHEQQIELKHGEYKTQENNPRRNDGQIVSYCPPIQVASEMDKLIEIYNTISQEKVHPIIIAAWLHHAFTTIHPFQDGNGRIARLIASLVLIKHKYFPFTVLREDAKLKYFASLEQSDQGCPQPLVNYFCEIQKRTIEKVLNFKEVSSTSLDEVTTVLAKKLTILNKERYENEQKVKKTNRNLVFKICEKYLKQIAESLIQKTNNQLNIIVNSRHFNDTAAQNYYYGQIINYAKQHNYYVNFSLPKACITFRIEVKIDKIYQLCITLHHFGYGETTLAIGAFLEYLEKTEKVGAKGRIEAAIPLDIKPHVISIAEDIESRSKNIKAFLDNTIAVILGQIASEI